VPQIAFNPIAQALLELLKPEWRHVDRGHTIVVLDRLHAGQVLGEGRRAELQFKLPQHAAPHIQQGQAAVDHFVQSVRLKSVSVRFGLFTGGIAGIAEMPFAVALHVAAFGAGPFDRLRPLGLERGTGVIQQRARPEPG
jgi:hypothetical protein